MNFDDLYTLALEAKGTKPGERYFNTQRQIGPRGVTGTESGISDDGQVFSPETSRGYASGPVGVVDNFEKRQKIDPMRKYGVDPTKMASQKDVYQMEAENNMRMRNSFALLFNSKNFYSEFKKIYSEYMGRKKEGDDENNNLRNSISFEEEREFNRLIVEVDRRASNITAIRNNIDELTKLKAEAENAAGKISEINDYIKRLKNKKSKSKDTDLRNNIDEQIKQAQMDISLRQSSAKQSSINTYQKEINTLGKTLISDEGQYLEAKQKLEELQDKISTVTEKNIKNNDNVILLVKELIKDKAKNLYLRYKIENDISDEEIDSKNVDFVKVPKDIASKLKLLKQLSTDDNPIFSFIDEHERQFQERMQEFDSRLMNSSINIGMMRMFDKLPAKILGKYFSSIATNAIDRKTIPLENLDSSPAYEALKEFINKLESIRNKQDWEDATKVLKPMVKKLPFSKLDKDIINDRLKGFYSVNRMGFTNVKQLLSTIQSMKKEVIGESFDELAERYASSFNLDINDFMIDLQEVHSLLESSEKRFKKVVKNKKTGRTKTVRYGQAGKAKDGGDRIRPGTSKGDAYCARSNKIKGDWRNDPNSPNRLSRKKWKCKGDKSAK
jgi:DNA repair exonuclease SbcCD ATPase subunit